MCVLPSRLTTVLSSMLTVAIFLVVGANDAHAAAPAKKNARSVPSPTSEMPSASTNGAATDVSATATDPSTLASDDKVDATDTDVHDPSTASGDEDDAGDNDQAAARDSLLLFKVFEPGARAASVCVYSDATESYACPKENLERFNVDAMVAIESSDGAMDPPQVALRFDDDGCLLAVDFDFASHVVDRRVQWEQSSFFVGGKESDFFVESSDGTVEDGYETSTMIMKGSRLRESVVGKRGRCVAPSLDDEDSADKLMVAVKVDEGKSSGVSEYRIVIDRKWTSIDEKSAARALPEPTEPLPSSFWPWVVGGMAGCGVLGCCGAPACAIGGFFGSSFVMALVAGAVSSLSFLTEIAAAMLLIGIPTIVPVGCTTTVVGLVGGLIGGGGIGYGTASALESTFPDDKESDARWQAWRAFRKKHGLPTDQPLKLKKKPETTAMAH